MELLKRAALFPDRRVSDVPGMRDQRIVRACGVSGHPDAKVLSKLLLTAFLPFFQVSPKSSENVFLHPRKEVCFPLIFPEEQDGFERD